VPLPTSEDSGARRFPEMFSGPLSSFTKEAMRAVPGTQAVWVATPPCSYALSPLKSQNLSSCNLL
jgi:hypothetical protein